MTRSELSRALDEARAHEEHHRAMLLLWKRRRQQFEAMIPTANALIAFIIDELEPDDGDKSEPL
jgi:hypothetical protein